MAFEKELVVRSKKVIGISEFAVSSRISIDLEKPLKKVLSISAIADICSSEAIDTDYNMLGKTQINVLYLSENNTLESVSTVAEWQNSIKAVGENLTASVKAVECKEENHSANELDISVLHNCLVRGVVAEKITPAEISGDDYVVDKNSILCNNLSSIGLERFVITETAELSAQVNNILSSNAYVTIKNVYAGIDQVTIEGNVELKVLYSTADGINTYTKVLDFKQEVASMQALPGQEAEAMVEIVSHNTTLESGEKCSIIETIGLRAEVITYNKQNFEVPRDVFSIKKELKVTNNCIDYSAFEGVKYYTDTAVCTSNIESDGVDEVVAAVNPDLSISRSTIENGMLIVEGVISSSLIYKNNEAETYSSIRLTQPFISKVAAELSGGVDVLAASAQVASVKIRSGKEIELMFDISISARSYAENYFEYIQSVEEIGDLEDIPSAITVYVTKPNESLFDVSRALRVTPETITSQNDVAQSCFSGGQRIFVYRPLDAEF